MQEGGDRLRAVRELPEVFQPLFSFRWAAHAARMLHLSRMRGHAWLQQPPKAHAGTCMRMQGPQVMH
jgi:hypothetical protein